MYTWTAFSLAFFVGQTCWTSSFNKKKRKKRHVFQNSVFFFSPTTKTSTEATIVEVSCCQSWHAFLEFSTTHLRPMRGWHVTWPFFGDFGNFWVGKKHQSNFMGLVRHFILEPFEKWKDHSKFLCFFNPQGLLNDNLSTFHEDKRSANSGIFSINLSEFRAHEDRHDIVLGVHQGWESRCESWCFEATSLRFRAVFFWIHHLIKKFKIQVV